MIEYHADDYGLFPEQSRAIIDCYHNGALNGISIMPNSPYLKECMEAISDIREKLFVTVHLNIVEGKPLTGQKAAGLTDKNGNFNISFIRLLLISAVPILRLRYKSQLKREIEAQIKMCEPYMNGGIYRLDSHVHYHMVPVVFDALMEVVKENSLKVAYIRFPREEASIYFRAGRLKGITLVNVLKVLILNILAERNERKYIEQLSALGVEKKLFMGVMLSGHMFYDNVKACLIKAADVMADRGADGMEILFHPGEVKRPEEISQITSRDDALFMTSPNRGKEAETLRRLGGKLRR